MDKQMLRVRAMQRIGNVLENEGDYAGAQGSLERALALAKDEVQQASILNDMGWVMMREGALEKANQYSEQALTLCRKREGNDPLLADIFDHLGTVTEQRGNVDAALQFHQQSFAIKSKLGDTHGLAESANNMGMAYRTAERFSEAMQSFEQCLELNEQIGYQLGIATAKLNIGMVYDDQDSFPEAIVHYQHALQSFEQIGQRHSMALCLDNLASCYEALHDYASAQECLFRAMTLYEELGDTEGQERIQSGLAELKLAQQIKPGTAP